MSKFFQICLSSLTVYHGLIFIQLDLPIIRLFGVFYYLFSLVKEVYNAYSEFHSILNWVANEIEFCGMLIYAFVLFIKGKSIVNYVLTNINLLSPFHSKLISIYIIIINVSFIIDWIHSAYLLFGCSINFRTGYIDPSRDFTFFEIVDVIVYPYRSWTGYSSALYGLMYFLMHLKHDEIINQLAEKKQHTYSVMYRAMTQFETNHEYFDSLVCSFPAAWLLNIFLGMNEIGRYISKVEYKISLYCFIFQDLICWTLTYIFINTCRIKLRTKIRKLKYFIAVKGPLDEPRGLIIQLLDQMANFHVNAGYLIKLDTGLLLPFIGSICTYTFLFKDKFTQNF